MTGKAGQVKIISKSGLLDEQWYLAAYPDVRQLGMGAAEHYLRIGARLLRNPGPGFDTSYYLAAYPDVATDGRNPLLHYIAYGRNEGRRCLSPAGSGKAVRETVPAAAAAVSPLVLRQGLRIRDPASKTILVCAHVAGQRMFGGERSLLDVVTGLSQLGYNVVVTLPGAGNPGYVDALREHSVAVISLHYGWWRRQNPVSERAVAAFAQVIAQQLVDAVHANTIMLREPLIAARRMGIPAVVHVREIITHDEALRELIGEDPQAIIEQVVDGVDWVLANSQATARCFPKAGATIVVANTVDAAAFDLPVRNAGDEVRIAMVSSNLPKKGIHDFAEIAQLLHDRLPRARFVLVGPENQHTKMLKDRQLAGGLPSNIEFAGYFSSAVDAMREADIILSLSHFQESFGRTVLEAMAARRPVVAYDWGAVPELVCDGETGYVVPFRDIAAVVERLQEMCANPQRIQAMGEAGRRRALALYDLPHFARSLGAAYEAVFAARDEPSLLVLHARNGAGLPHIAKPLRLAYFLWHFPVPSETFVLNELRILVEQGHDVRVYCRQSPHKEFKPDFPILWDRVGSPEDLASRLLEHGRTIVHSHFVYPTVTEMVWPACESAGIPFTFIAHAQDIFRHTNDEKNRIGEIGRSPLCLRVVVPSRFHRDYVESRGVPAAKLLINPNGVDPELYAAGRDPKRPLRRRRSICAVHRFTEKKGLVHLIEAGRALAADGIDIHLYGYGELEGEYRELVAQMGLENVHVHGALGSRDEILEVFRQHDLFACPSVRARDGDMDGIPTVLMDAMASGLPVLATATAGIPDLVTDEVTGIICDASAVSIANAVRRFYAMPDSQVRAIIEDAHARIAGDFHVAKLTSALLRLWQRQSIDVAIVSWNNLPELREVIRRLQKFTQMPFHLVICDNGSSADVVAHLCEVYAEFGNTTIVLNRENVYVGPGTNICLMHGSSQYAVYVCGKEGFVLDYGWEKSLVDYMDAHPDVGLAGTLCHSPTYLTGAAYPDGVPLFSKFRNPGFATDNPDRRFAHVQGGFFVLRRAMYEAIGGFSNDVPHSYTDVEYSYYAESCGWKLGTPPRLLALFNKTRPGLFSRVDESIAAAHPPTLEHLPLLDRIARGDIAYCNICGWQADVFVSRDGLSSCGGCGSRPVDRSLYRYLAESTLTYRRLPALGVNVGASMQAIWKKQFQGQQHSTTEVRRIVAQHGKLEFQEESLKLVYLDEALEGGAEDASLLREIDRLLAPDGILLLRLAGVDRQQLAAVSQSCHLHGVQPMRFSSRVLRYDSLPLYIGRRGGVDLCVS